MTLTWVCGVCISHLLAAVTSHHEVMALVPVDDPRFALRAALKGLRSARQRFLVQATPGAAPEDVFVPLAEALWWTVNVDRAFEDLAGTDPGYRPNLGDYRQARNEDQYGRVLRGLRYARNRGDHQRVFVALEAGLGYPRTYPKTYGDYFRWRHSDQLPPPDPSHPDADLRPVYDGLLAGHPAAETLDAAVRWFELEESRAAL